MATFTHTLSLKVTPAGNPISCEIAKPGDGQTSRSIDIADSVDDQLVDIGINVSEIQSIYMKSNQDLKVETNDGAAPDDTIDLLADEPYIWWTGSYFTNLLTVDITKLYLTNASGAAAVFELEVVVDSTP